ncbi:restriction endonuclease subunit S [Microbacterium sp. LWH3-1.2]|uniref:restriction endonuclease subunit S n=1 Tax=Microbacterium sp. LWH3-1.2 TaxID=3135256 RepID=UPI00343FB71C
MSVAIKTVRLGDPEVSEVFLGQSPPSATYNEHREGLPFYQGKADFGLVHPTPRVWCRQGSKFAKPNDVLISVRAPVGDVNMATEDAVIGRGVSAIRAAEGVDPWYLYFALGFMKPALEAQATGSTFASVNGATLRDLQIPLVPFEDQTAISRTLRLLLTQLQGEERALESAAETKAAAMQRLFSQGLRDEPQKETEIGQIPEGWELATIDKHFSVTSGGTPSRGNDSYWVGGTIPWVKTTEVNYSVITETAEHITQAGLDGSAAKMLGTGTLLMAMYGQGVTRGKVGILGIEASCNQACAAMTPTDDDVLPRYLYHFLTSRYEAIRLLAHGGQQQNLNLDIVRKIDVPVPSTTDEQQEIVDVLDALDRKIDLHRRKRDVIGQLFKSLLHKLMTGEVSVDDLDVSALSTLEGSTA